MRTIIALCAFIFVSGGFFIWHSMQLPSRFGEFTGAPLVSVADIVNRPKNFAGKTVSVEGTVQDQCKSMGCYFYIHSPKGTLRVELKDVAMTAPRREGHRARVEGQIVPYNDGYQLYASAVDFE